MNNSTQSKRMLALFWFHMSISPSVHTQTHESNKNILTLIDDTSHTFQMTL